MTRPLRITGIGTRSASARPDLLYLGTWSDADKKTIAMFGADWARLMRRWGRASNPYSLIRWYRPDSCEVREARGGGLLLRLVGHPRWVLVPSAREEDDD